MAYINLIDELSNLDKKRIENYIYTYGANKENFIGIDAWLQDWSHSNQKLYKLLGNKLIYSEPFEYNKNISDMRAEIYDKLLQSTFKQSYHEFYKEKIASKIEDFETKSFFNHLLDINNLIDNEVYLGIKYKKDENSKLLQIPKGTKIMRACQRVINYFKNDWNFEGFEEFRLNHSMIYNNRKSKGELCFSIHPLDFMTMSDNASSWSSCMSWKEEGCYHVGTIEMMNSNCVICCYIKSIDSVFNFYKPHYTRNFSFSKEDKDMLKNDSEEWCWNNKKWRQLAYFTKDIIMSGKSYPYQDDDFSNIVISKIKELAEKNLNKTYQFGPERYMDMVHLFNTYSFNRARQYMKYSPRKHNILWDTRGMYNDMINDHSTKYMCYRNKVNHTKIINTSGKATCLCCGESIIEENDYYDIYNERYSNVGEVVCKSCYNHSPYCEIGDHNIGVIRKSINISLDNNTKYTACEGCFIDRLRVCDCCGKVFFTEDNCRNYLYLTEGIDKLDKKKSIKITNDTIFYDTNSYYKLDCDEFMSKKERKELKKTLIKPVSFCRDCFNEAKENHKIDFILLNRFWGTCSYELMIDTDKYSSYKKIIDNNTKEKRDADYRKIDNFIDKKNYDNIPSFSPRYEICGFHTMWPLDSDGISRMDIEKRNHLFNNFKINEKCIADKDIWIL